MPSHNNVSDGAFKTVPTVTLQFMQQQTHQKLEQNNEKIFSQQNR